MTFGDELFFLIFVNSLPVFDRDPNIIAVGKVIFSTFYLSPALSVSDHQSSLSQNHSLHPRGCATHVPHTGSGLGVGLAG